MNFISKLICLLFYCLFAAKIFPQGQSYIPTNGNINNSFLTRSIYNTSTFTPLKKNNSAEDLDSLIYISTKGDKARIAYYYNDDLSLNYFTNARWYNGEWITLDKHTNTYNSNRNLESVLWESFNTKTKEWSKDIKDIYKYDSSGNRVFHLHQDFNGQEFENAFKYDYCYDAANNLVSSLNQYWIDGIWVNRYQSIYTYTPKNVNDTMFFQTWTNDKWVNIRINIYKYNEINNITTIKSKTWLENKWENIAMGSFEYGDNDNLIIEDWVIANNNKWENWFSIFYEYDNNNLIHLYGEEWENGKWVSENEPLKVTNPDGILYGYIAKEIFLYYSKPTSVESEKNIADGFNLLQNYPNPFNPETVIGYQIPVGTSRQVGSVFVQLKIYDILGKEVATLVNEEKSPGSYEISFNAGNLPSGIYFYQLKTENYTQTKKMLLLR